MKKLPRSRMAMSALAIASLASAVPRALATSGSSASPDAADRVRAMSDLLAAAPALKLTTHEVHRWIDAAGKPEQIEGASEIELWRPDALRIEAHGSGARPIDHTLYYDGNVLALENHARKVFARAAVPHTVDEMLDEVAWRFNLPIPSADLLYQSPQEALLGEGTAGRFVGVENIAGKSCDHFAFVGPVVDWEIWIAVGPEAVPCRLDIVRKQLPGPPRSEIRIERLDRSPTFTVERFIFAPREGYEEIAVVENPPPAEPSAEATEPSNDGTEGGARP